MEYAILNYLYIKIGTNTLLNAITLVFGRAYLYILAAGDMFKWVVMINFEHSGFYGIHNRRLRHSMLILTNLLSFTNYIHNY